MGYAINRDRGAIWRDGASPAETARVAAIDARLAAVEAERKALADERREITNRACSRARYRQRSGTEG